MTRRLICSESASPVFDGFSSIFTAAKSQVSKHRERLRAGWEWHLFIGSVFKLVASFVHVHKLENADDSDKLDEPCSPCPRPSRFGASQQAEHADRVIFEQARHDLARRCGEQGK
jgi:hypothetical protein